MLLYWNFCPPAKPGLLQVQETSWRQKGYDQAFFLKLRAFQKPFIQETSSYSPGSFREMKRSCYSVLPACFKSSPPARRGIELSRFTIIKAIAVPLVVVAVDVATDGNLLYDMKSYIDHLKATSTRSRTINSTDDYMRIDYIRIDAASGLFLASQVILICSILNLIFGNPAKTLIRNARTSALMASRELETKDVPVPIGDIFTLLQISIFVTQFTCNPVYCDYCWKL